MMHKNYKKILTSFVILLSGTYLISYANVAANQPLDPNDTQKYAFFLELGTGASFSRKADISVDTSIFDPAPEGYNNTLGTTALYTAGIGYIFNPLLNFDVSVTHRGEYKYEKFQSAPIGTNFNPLGPKTRFFDLNSNDLMFNFTLNGQGISDYLVLHLGPAGLIQPFIGGGLGVAFNTLKNFHTIVAGTGIVGNTIPDETKTSFAFQGNAGLEWQYHRVGVDVGYRYFDGGDFKTNDYFATSTTITGAFSPPILIPPWKGKLRTNEVFVTAKVLI